MPDPMIETQNCPSCDMEISEWAKKCPHCGEFVASSVLSIISLTWRTHVVTLLFGVFIGHAILTAASEPIIAIFSQLVGTQRTIENISKGLNYAVEVKEAGSISRGLIFKKVVPLYRVKIGITNHGMRSHRQIHIQLTTGRKILAHYISAPFNIFDVDGKMIPEAALKTHFVEKRAAAITSPLLHPGQTIYMEFIVAKKPAPPKVEVYGQDAIGVETGFQN